MNHAEDSIMIMPNDSSHAIESQSNLFDVSDFDFLFSSSGKAMQPQIPRAKSNVVDDSSNAKVEFICTIVELATITSIFYQVLLSALYRVVVKSRILTAEELTSKDNKRLDVDQLD